ncbi:MAG: hypothetical protein ACLTPN_02010 [Clostridia bacterium]
MIFESDLNGDFGVRDKNHFCIYLKFTCKKVHIGVKYSSIVNNKLGGKK